MHGTAGGALRRSHRDGWDDGVAGRAVAGVRAAARKVRPEIGMVFQQFNLWRGMTVLQNIIEAPMRVRGLGRDEAIAMGKGC